MSNLYWLSQITAEEQFLVGEKAFLLSQFLQSNFSIMPGLILDHSVFEEFISVLDSSRFLMGIFPQSALYLSTDNHRALQSVANKSRQTILSTAFPGELKAQIYTAARKLNSPKLILRPSLIIARSQPQKKVKSLPSKARGESYSYGGSDLLSSQVCNCDPETIALGIKRIWADLFSAKSLLYWDKLGIDLRQVRTTILIQPIENAIASGTVTIEDRQGMVRANWGLDRSLQRGEVEPDRYLVNISTATIIEGIIGFKTHGYRLADANLSTTEDPHRLIERPIQESHTHKGFWDGKNQHGVAAANLSEEQLTKDSVKDLPAEILLKTPKSTRHSTRSRKLTEKLERYLIDESERKKAVLESSQIKYLIRLIEEITLKNSQICYLEWTLLPQTTDSPSVNFLFTQLSNRTPVQEDPDRLFRVHLEEATHFTEGGVTGWEKSERSQKTDSTQSNQKNFGDLPLKNFRHQRQPLIGNAPTKETHEFESIVSDKVGSAKILLRGVAAARGRVTAKVVVRSLLDNEKKPLPPGVILVTKIIQPQEISLLQNVAGIITEVGGKNSHGAILARELGIPAIVDAANATRILSGKKIVTLDGDRGIVDTSSNHSATTRQDKEREIKHFYTDGFAKKIPLATKLMVNLSQPNSIEQTAKLSIDGVGLIRGEFMLLEALSIRSLKLWLKPDLQTELLEYISAAIRKFAVAFAPKPIYYRSLDFPLSDTQESNSVLGIRGTAAYLLDPTLFELELRALAQIMAEGNRNIKLILPFVRSLQEWQFCRDLVKKVGLTSYPGFQLWMMVEIPSAIFLLPEYIKAGVQGIAIGTNDLIQLLLGVDRERAILAHESSNCNSPAVDIAISKLIETARIHQIPCSICLSASSNNSELIDKLVRWGVTAISVEAQTVTETYREIARAEKRLLLDR